MLTALAVAGLVAFALLSTEVKAFWARVRQGLTIIFDRRRYFREVWLVQFGGWCFRFAAFWFLLDAFHVGGSVKNVLLVLGVNAVAAVRAVHARRRGRPAGVPGEGLRRDGGGRDGGGLLGRPADRDRRVQPRGRLLRAGLRSSASARSRRSSRPGASTATPSDGGRWAAGTLRFMEGFGGLFGDPDELQRRMAEFADQMQGQQRLAWADNAIGLAVQMTVAAVNRVNIQGTTAEQAEQIRAVMATVFPEAVTLVREARAGPAVGRTPRRGGRRDRVGSRLVAQLSSSQLLWRGRIEAGPAGRRPGARPRACRRRPPLAHRRPRGARADHAQPPRPRRPALAV